MRIVDRVVGKDRASSVVPLQLKLVLLPYTESLLLSLLPHKRPR